MFARISLVVASLSNGGIGADNDLPWPSSSVDLKQFRELTTNSSNGRINVVVMGKHTAESIKKNTTRLKTKSQVIGDLPFALLPSRACIVLSTEANPDSGITEDKLSDQQIYYESSIASAFNKIRDFHDGTVSRIFVIGGGNLYHQFLQPSNCRTEEDKIWCKCLEEVHWTNIQCANTELVDLLPKQCNVWMPFPRSFISLPQYGIMVLSTTHHPAVLDHKANLLCQTSVYHIAHEQ